MIPTFSINFYKMDSYYRYLNNLININKREFGRYQGLKWISPWQAAELEAQRNQLLMEAGNQSLFKDTKPFLNHISKGCQLCGEGQWSCLFITGQCNANCFYCPAPQEKDEPPESQGLIFPTPEAYAEYINYFGFKGVSFSGGEPLLVRDRVMQYLKAVRNSCNPDIYTWMYTNGLLANREIFKSLADRGLDEVRFDIGATGYQLKYLEQARNVISNVTVEIPAIPEQKALLIELLPKLVNAGVTNLNLHQLRLTHHNAPKLIKRGYTYIPAERPIVLESELTALEVMAYAQKNNIPIGINYCSFHFKYRFQKAGYRKIIAKKFKNTGEKITEKGYIRLRNGAAINYDGITLHSMENSKLAIPSSLLELTHKKYGVQRSPARKITIDDQHQMLVADILNNSGSQIPKQDALFEIWQHEYIEKGLRSY